MSQKQNLSLPIEESPEVKSFIYQQIVDFEPFLTESTMVSVVSKFDENEKRRSGPLRHNIQFSINENGVTLAEEGSSENIFEAILEAKNKLYRKLILLQESAISQKERLAHIQSIKTGGNIH